MRVILSRKGFDSASGGVPSPILPEGTLCPLPIPSNEAPSLKDVMWRGKPLSDVVSAITNQRIAPGTGVHLDPDLRKQARPRSRGWRPSFGQVDSAQSHLQNRGVDVGDVFLFFGWFRATVRVNGQLSFDRASADLHVIFGWLQVDRMLHPTADGGSIPSWAADHPHVRRARSMGANNTLYVGSKHLELPCLSVPISATGVFGKLSPDRTLTADGKSRSVWRLPSLFNPTPGKPSLSFHSDSRRWRTDSTGCYLQTVGRGPEFVLDCDCFPEADAWLRRIFTNTT